jgi:hypothetical protein
MTARKQTLRKEAVAFPKTLRKLAEEAAAHPNVSNEEKKVLREAVEQLDTSVEALANIFAAHDAMQLGDDWREPFDPNAHIHLWIALAAAFTIGGRVISNPIIEEAMHKARRAQTAPGRHKRRLNSKKIVDAIRYAAEDAWRQNPELRKSAGKTKNAIAAVVNRGLKQDEPLSDRAIEERVLEIMRELGMRGPAKLRKSRAAE